MNYRLILLFSFFSLIYSQSVFSKNIIINESFSGHKITESEFLIFEDPLNQVHPKNEKDLDLPFRPYEVNAGVSSSSWWIKIAVVNESESGTYYLYTDHAAFEYVKLYQQSEFNSLIVDSAGCKIPFNTRKVKINTIAFKLNLNPGLNVLYLKINTPIIKIPFSIVTEKELYNNVNDQRLYYNWLNGVLLILSLISLATSFYIRKDQIYIKYFLYVLCILLSFNSYIGYGFQFFWPESTEWNSKSYLFLGVLLTVFHLVFASDLLKIKTISILFYKILMSFSLLLMAISILILFLNITYGVGLAQIFIFASIPFSFTTIYFSFKNRSPIVFYYIVGYILFILPMAMASLKYLDFMPLHLQGNDNLIYLGMVIEIIFFSIALGIRTKENLIEMNTRLNPPIESLIEEFLTIDILTKKENEIFNYAGQQLSDNQIAEKSGTTIHTVRYHLRNVYEKLEIKNRIMLLQKYKEAARASKKSNIMCSDSKKS